MLLTWKSLRTRLAARKAGLGFVPPTTKVGKQAAWGGHCARSNALERLGVDWAGGPNKRGSAPEAAILTAAPQPRPRLGSRSQCLKKHAWGLS